MYITAYVLDKLSSYA